MLVCEPASRNTRLALQQFRNRLSTPVLLIHLEWSRPECRRSCSSAWTMSSNTRWCNSFLVAAGGRVGLDRMTAFFLRLCPLERIELGGRV